MNLQDLLLKKEELPIINKNCFEIPIHPKLLRLEKIDEDFAKKSFRETTTDWYEELLHYRNTEKLDEQTKSWYDEVFLKEKPKIKEEFGKQILNTLSWEDYTQFFDNGLVSGFSISRNSGGTLYFNNNDENCEDYILLNGHSRYFRFSSEKAKEFSFKTEKLEDEKEIGKVYVYGHHNIDYYPGALFLRNWAINYMNKLLPLISDQN